jgi:nitrogen fixation protein NifZ
MQISRDSDVVELNGPPAFEFGEKVRSRKTIRNDGTFRGKDIGAILVKKGDVGYVVSIGTFLQQFYIYGVDFPAHGYRVGLKRKELESLDATPLVGVVPAETTHETGATP